MKLQHTDATRKAPQYCNAICVLCGAAARMQLASKHSTDLSQSSQQIREMRTTDYVFYEHQEPVVQAFLMLAGLPAITPTEPTTTGEPRPRTAVTSAGEEDPGS